MKDQILRMDSTMVDVKFGYTDSSGGWHPVSTLEEDDTRLTTTVNTTKSQR
ncbi:hypothetical protein N806_17045 [Rhodococcus sp. P27]|nr:hypothetical protein N806_17045 [Rhodococcus sp. P27]